MDNKHKIGLEGQQAAEVFLRNKGYEVLARNYRTKSGEIDLIAKHGEYIVFVEVKFRKSLGYGYPREAVSSTKQKRIINTAMHYLTNNDLTNCDIRFDVVEVLKQHGQLYASHIENAFGA